MNTAIVGGIIGIGQRSYLVSASNDEHDPSNGQFTGDGIDTAKAVKQMQRDHDVKWLPWYSKMQVLAKNNGGLEADLSDVGIDEIVDAGFSKPESKALQFIMTQKVAGRDCKSVELIDKWFVYQK